VPTRLLKRFGARIVLLRREREWTQEQLAEHSGISVPHLSHLENGKREPCLLTMEKLAKAFRVDLAELMGGLQK
jgi:transcriptional regulator with XRE-family HTH domain